MLATIHAATLTGIDSMPVEVQALFGKGIPEFDIVGLGDAAVRESRVRVKSALESSGLSLPHRNVVLNLAPADMRKTGSALDLSIALALLCAGGVTDGARLEGVLVLGELTLSGELRGVRGVLAHLRASAKRGLRRAILPAADAAEPHPIEDRSECIQVSALIDEALRAPELLRRQVVWVTLRLSRPRGGLLRPRPGDGPIEINQ
jgi:magnesium chelatase family protein